jgi:hypothetical protein
MVVESGSKNGRLHIHVAIGRSYLDNYFGSGCSSCSAPSYVLDPADDGKPCFGCIWGNGWVHGPQDSWEGEIRADGDPNKTASYVSKYLAKDLQGISSGRNVYRVARGFQPSVLRLVAFDLASLQARVSSIVSSDPRLVDWYPVHEHVEDFAGGAMWLFSAPVSLLPSVGGLFRG